MAKVIGYNEQHRYKANCADCSAIVEYVKNELFSNGTTDEGMLIKWLTCPGCGHMIRTNY